MNLLLYSKRSKRPKRKNQIIGEDRNRRLEDNVRSDVRGLGKASDS